VITSTVTESNDSAAELRAAIARKMIPVYVLSSAVGLHPAHLGQVLRGRRPLTPELEERIKHALNEEHMRVAV
jgi:hypothetical protein